MFSQKVIVITGAGSGIGAASARHLASLGANIILNGRRAEPLARVAQEINQLGKGRALAVQGDASVESDLIRIRNVATKEFGRVDAFFANAAIEGSGKLLANTSAEELVNIFAVNNVSLMLGLKVFQNELEKTKGTFVVTSSGISFTTPGSLPDASLAPYAMTKAAADTFVRAVAGGLAAKGIRVIALNPGAYSSEMADRAATNEASTSLGFTSTAQMGFFFNPLGNVGDPRDVALVLEHALRSDSKFATGDIVLVVPSAVPGKPITSPAQHFYAHVMDRAPFTANYATMPIHDETGSARSDEAEIRKGLVEHQAKLVAAIAAAAKN